MINVVRRRRKFNEIDHEIHYLLTFIRFSTLPSMKVSPLRISPGVKKILRSHFPGPQM